MQLFSRAADRVQASALDRLCGRWAAGAVGFVLALAAAAGVVRLLPWLMSRDLPVQLAGPFAAALAASAVETAFLVGIPIGFAIGTAVFVERGEARALSALGASPSRLAMAGWRSLVIFGLIACTAGAAWGAETDRPGVFARSLLVHGKASCELVETAQSVLVPVVGVTWLCFPNRPPRVTGALPTPTTQVWFTAADLTPNEDLRQFEIDDLRVVARSTTLPDLRLHVGVATITGLRPWGRTAALSVLQRAILIAATTTSVAWLLGWLLMRFGFVSRLQAAGAGGAAALTMLALLHAFDRTAVGLLSYLTIPLAGAAVACVVLVLERTAEGVWRATFGRRYATPASD